MLVGGLPIGNTGMQGMIVIFCSLEAHVHIQKYAISQSNGLPYCGGESVAEGFPCAGAWILRFERQGRDWSSVILGFGRHSFGSFTSFNDHQKLQKKKASRQDVQICKLPKQTLTTCATRIPFI
jgi:hypothetical protein